MDDLEDDIDDFLSPPPFDAYRSYLQYGAVWVGLQTLYEADDCPQLQQRLLDVHNTLGERFRVIAAPGRTSKEWRLSQPLLLRTGDLIALEHATAARCDGDAYPPLGGAPTTVVSDSGTAQPESKAVAPPPPARRVPFTSAAEKRLGGPVWLDVERVAATVGPLYPLYREPGRHSAPLAEERRTAGVVLARRVHRGNPKQLLRHLLHLVATRVVFVQAALVLTV